MQQKWYGYRLTWPSFFFAISLTLQQHIETRCLYRRLAELIVFVRGLLQG